MKKFTRSLKANMIPILIIDLIGILGAIFYVTLVRYKAFYDLVFWQNAVSNFLATLLGLLLGIPIALWLNNIQQRNLEKTEYEKSQDEALQRKKKILDSLRLELTRNLQLFKSYEKFEGAFTLRSFFDFDPGLREEKFAEIYNMTSASSLEVWKSFSDGGELEWVKDVSILSLLAKAYHSTQQVKDSGRLFIEAYFPKRPNSWDTVSETIRKLFEMYVELAVADIEDALSEI